MKFVYNEFVKCFGYIAMVKDSEIVGSNVRYLIEFEDISIWVNEDDIVKYRLDRHAEVGERVAYYDNGFKYGFVVDIDYKHGFRYLVEMPNRERYWKAEAEISVR